MTVKASISEGGDTLTRDGSSPIEKHHLRMVFFCFRKAPSNKKRPSKDGLLWCSCGNFASPDELPTGKGEAMLRIPFASRSEILVLRKAPSNKKRPSKDGLFWCSCGNFAPYDEFPTGKDGAMLRIPRLRRRDRVPHMST